MNHEQNDDLVLLDNLEIEPLSDDDLEAVAGGGCSLWCCSNGTKDPAELEPA